MHEILSSSRTTILKTSLTEELFAKTKSARLLDETGFFARKKDGGFDFIPWKFTGTKSEGGRVFFEGGKFNGSTLSCILKRSNEGSDTDEKNARDALCALVEAYTDAIKKNVKLPCSGAFGIMYGSLEGREGLLFVPEKTFDRCAANLGREAYGIMQEPWKDTALSGTDALVFARAVCAYFALSKNLPYPPQKTDKSVNISYKNFIPLELAVNGIDGNLAKSIDRSLEGKFGSGDFPKETFTRELYSPESRKPKFSEEEFTRNREKFSKNRERKILKRRKFNRIKGTVAAALTLASFSAVFTATALNENSKKPTAVGLSSQEVSRLFYQGIHRMDTNLMLAAAKNCPEAQGYISRIPQIYIVANMKSAFNFESGISTPENWLFFEPGSSRAASHFIYGITNFTLDGKSSTLNDSVPERRSHRPPLSRLNGKRLDDFSRAEHTAHYWLVHTVDDMMRIEEFTTAVSLKWVKKSWQIAFLSETKTEHTVDPARFSEDYRTSLDENGGDIAKSAETLRKKYPWIPSEPSIHEEKARLEKIGY